MILPIALCDSFRMKHVGPNRQELQAMLDRGLTQQQVADEWEERTGIKVTRSSISVNILRWGLESAHPRRTYDDLIPWRVAPEHQNLSIAKCLRLVARDRRGIPLSDDNRQRMEYFLEDLRENDAVIAYSPDTGFRFVRRRPEHVDIVDTTGATAKPYGKG